MTKSITGIHMRSRDGSSSRPLAILIVVGTAVSIPVAAQGALEEIVVTAQKREQSLQDVPIAITAVDGDFARDMGIETGVELAHMVPGLIASGTSNTDQRFAIRGVGSLLTTYGGAETSVGVYLDNVYSGQTYLGAANFFDVDHIEVVKGPQGTLFGRNTSGGVISVTSKKADRAESYLDTRIGFGNENQQIYEAIGNFSQSDDWGVRAGIQYQERDGTFENTTNGEELNDVDDLIARISFQRDWSDRFHSDAKLDYFNSGARTGATVFDPFDYERSASVRSVTQQPRDDAGLDLVRGSLTLAYDISDTLTFTSITALLDASLNVTTVDSDLSTLEIVQYDAPTDHSNVSQEFRLNGATGSVDWFVGASVFHEDSQADISVLFSDFDLFPLLPSFLPPGSLPEEITCPTSPVADLCTADARETVITTNETLALGVYADATWQATDKLALTVGARYSRDDKDPTTDIPAMPNAVSTFFGGYFFMGPTTETELGASESWSNVSPRFAATYQYTESVMGYASVSFGYKAGGFNIFPDDLPPLGRMQKFDEETVIAYEAGVKSDFADGRARLNAAVFFLDYEDFQYEDVNSIGFPTTLTIDAAENYGLDIEASFVPVDGLYLTLGYQYLESDVEKGTAEQQGNPLPFAPEQSVSLRGRYEVPVTWGLVGAQVAYSYVDDYFLDPTGDSIFANVRSHDTLDVRLDFRSNDEKWGLALVGENITDERWFHIYELSVADSGYPNVGELWRAELSYRFD